MAGLLRIPTGRKKRAEICGCARMDRDGMWIAFCPAICAYRRFTPVSELMRKGK
jgi:hypothetical protein